MTVFCKIKKARISSYLLGCLLLCLPGLGAKGVAQVTRIGQGLISTFAGMQGANSETSNETPQAPTLDQIGSPSAILADSNGNVYFADGQLGVVWLVYVAGTPPPLLTKLYPPPVQLTKGYAYAIVNVPSQPCYAGTPCGDNGPATQAGLNSFQLGLALDASQNLYISDGLSGAVRKVDVTNGNISTIAGDPMHMNFGYNGDNIAATSALLNGPNSVAFDGNGNLYVSDANNAIIRMINPMGTISTVAGTVPNGDGTPNFCTVAPCGDTGQATAAHFGYVDHIFIDKAGDIYVTDNALETIRRIDGQSHVINTVAGTLSLTQQTCDPPGCGDEGPATEASLNSPTASYLDSLGNLYIADTNDDVVRVVDTGQIIHTVVGQLANPAYSGDGSPAIQATLNAPDAVAVDPSGNLYIADTNNNVVRMVTALPPLPPQTLNFVQTPTNVTYGGEPIDLSSDVTSTNSQGQPTGLGPAFVVISGPGTIVGSTLTPTGAGMIVVEARQAGSNKYAPATPVRATITVNPATLTVTAPPDYPLKNGDPIPASLPYSISGYVSPDTQTGAPVLQVEGPAGPLMAGTIPPAGSYVITVTQGSLITGANYTFAAVPGKLLVSRGLPQTLTFGSYTPPTVYGGANSTFTFSVTSSATLSTLYPTVTSSGPVQVMNLSPTTWSATVSGAGAVTVSAVQAGDFNYAQATAISQFVVGPATLTVPLMNATRPYGAPNPTFSYGTPTGFIGSDNGSKITGLPSYTTAATPTSAPGNYDITASQGTLFDPNYTIVFTKATLTVTQATQQINFAAPANVVVGGSGYPLAAMASTNLPLVYSATGPVQISSDGTTFQATGAGPATITATQAGNADYTSASATVSFNVAPAAQYITAAPVSVSFGAAIPQLNWCFASKDATTGLVACDSSIILNPNLYSGTPALTTTAVQGSVTGTYPITVSAGTLTSSVYAFTFAPGTLTITPASTYTLTVNPSSITLAGGQSAQATVTLTPINNYVGTVNIACSGLPAGVTCKADPDALTTSLNSQGIASPVSSMLTVSVSKTVAQNTIDGPSRLLAAGLFAVPGLFAGILIFYRRRQFNQRSTFTGILLLVALAASTTWVSACGGGGSHSGGAQPGTTQIMITGTSTASAGALGQSVGLTVTIQ